jgi:NAD(P)-dependent dehydrogenase (short-subunit alcohol dehydrogenase family)
MPDKRIALVTGANQGVGLQVAKELVANGVTVLVGSRIRHRPPLRPPASVNATVHALGWRESRPQGNC